LPKFFLIHIIIFFIFSCEKSSIIEIPNNVIFSNNIHLSIDGKFLLYKNKKFSGYLEEISSNNIKLSRIGYYNGRKEGIEKICYDNNKISEIRFYRKGKKIGVHKLFWDNGNNKKLLFDNFKSFISFQNIKESRHFQKQNDTYLSEVLYEEPSH